MSCPNPACGVQMPLVKTFQLSTKANNQHWLRPSIKHNSKSVTFTVQNHSDQVPNGTVNARGATCVACGNSVGLQYIRDEGCGGRIKEQLMAIVAEGDRKRLFIDASEEDMQIAHSAKPPQHPFGDLPKKALGFRVQAYGFTQWHQLFTARQNLSLSTLSDLVRDAREQIIQDGGTYEYASAVLTYLSLAFGRMVNASSSFATWQNTGDKISSVFRLQGIPIVWDFTEVNPFSGSTQNWMAQVDWVAKVVEYLPEYVNSGVVYQSDAAQDNYPQKGPIIVTDPPYYDNVGYADLSDYFYVWLRPILRDIYPDLFAGMLSPKDEEMTASPRFNDPSGHFEYRLSKSLRLIRERCSEEFPTSIFYAQKQQEERTGGTTSTGWETMLSAVVSAGFQIVGTWPMRIAGNRVRAVNSNALASYIILVCRPRSEDARIATRRQFLNELERELPAALDHLTREGHIAPVDLAQAAIGPGMEGYSKYSRVEMVSGEPVSVRDALIEINRVIAEYHRREQGELDAASQFCVEWLQEYGYAQGEYGRAEVLAQAKNVATEAAPLNGLLSSGGGRVTLLRMEDFAPDRPLSSGMTALGRLHENGLSFQERVWANR